MIGQAAGQDRKAGFTLQPPLNLRPDGIIDCEVLDQKARGPSRSANRASTSTEHEPADPGLQCCAAHWTRFGGAIERAAAEVAAAHPTARLAETARPSWASGLRWVTSILLAWATVWPTRATTAPNPGSPRSAAADASSKSQSHHSMMWLIKTAGAREVLGQLLPQDAYARTPRRVRRLAGGRRRASRLSTTYR
jgi:hypothetical protein